MQGHRFDPWSGKFHMPQRVWQKRKKKDCYHGKSMDVEVGKTWSSNSGCAHFGCEMSINTMLGLCGNGVHCDQQGAPSRKTTKAALPSRVGFGHASPPARNSADPLLVQRGLCFVFQLRQFPLWEARLLPHLLDIFNTPVPQLHL